jgi:enoyl-CoA hydratase/carnithine racemase
MTEFIKVTDDAAIRTVCMNRPDKRNALTLAMYAAMADALEGAGRNEAIRCLVLAGASGTFTAGNDLHDFLEMERAPGGLAAPILRFLYALVRCEKPLVAAVQGSAVGIGTTMLLHCDHVVVSSDARFSTPFVGLGLVPEAASSMLGPRLMGHSRAFSLLVMGRPMDAEAARSAGIVNSVVAPGDVEREAARAAREIAALPPEAVLAARRLLRGPADELIARIDAEAGLFRTRLKSAEARAAFSAFLTRKR